MLEQTILDRIRILIFIDHDVAKTVPYLLHLLCMGFKKLKTKIQDVFKIQRIASFQSFLILTVNLTCKACPRQGIGDQQLFRRSSSSFCMMNHLLGGFRIDQRRLRNAFFILQIPDQGQLILRVVNDEIFMVSQQINGLPENPHSK